MTSKQAEEAGALQN